MPTPTFKRISVDQFAQLLGQFPFSRQITAVHMHHTWKPRRADFRGHESIVAMWRHHTQVNGWRDIAQHVTIDPEGTIWLGRNWNLAPASAAGHNGNADFGPFMFEMVGDFDNGRDPFDGAQRDASLRVVALVQQRFGLATDTLRFHNMMSSKSCPGSALDHAAIVAAVNAIKQGAMAAAPRGRAVADPGPFPDEAALATASFIRVLTREVDAQPEPGDAELAHDEHDGAAADTADADAIAAAPAPNAGAAAARGLALTTAQIAAIRPHLINLTTGRLSSSGQVTTTPADVDAIFEEHLPLALAQAGAQPLQIVFYAHGGLVSEARGLVIAKRHIDWWQRNRVYPIYFVWETGFLQAIAELLSRRSRSVQLRGFDIDPVFEALARLGRGPSIWGSMKASGEHASDAPTANDPVGGGAHYTARKLLAFCNANPGRVELHAVGHSAGAGFHAGFLPLARGLGVPTFKSAHFMAPALRVDTFKDRLIGELGATASVESLTLFTMKKDFELDDNCAQIYRKSLLYLIFYALENERKTPLLGLEESLRGDAELTALFGLRGAPPRQHSIVWSPTPGDSGRSASRALAHGDFDDDPATMNSILRRVLGKDDADTIDAYPAARSVSAAQRSWFDEADMADGLGLLVPLAPSPLSAALSPTVSLGASTPAPTSAGQPAPAPGAPGSGRRVAVCIGIDAYPDPQHRLSGCVNDARRWSDALRGLGFDTTLLLDHQASRAAIAQSLESLVGSSRAGDVIVFQYAGHGTKVRDLDGDEDDATDEALCPVDFAAGALYIDDDIAGVLASLPQGVNLTFFMDCCHSGTNTRFAAAGAAALRLPGGTKARYIAPTAALEEAHRRFRQPGGCETRAASRSAGSESMRDIKFSACLDHQLALESGGSGEFTRRALAVLQAGIQSLSNDQFLQRVSTAFGHNPAQNPLLDCADDGRGRGLLQPLAGPGAASDGVATQARPAQPQAAADAQVLDTVHLLARAIDTLLSR